MSDGKFLTDQTKVLIAVFLYGLIRKKIPWFLRKIVKSILAKIINYIDTQADKVIPDKIDSLVNIAIVSLNEGDFDKCGQSIGVALDLLVEVQNVDGIKKRNAFVSGSMFLLDLIETKRKNVLV